jgi:hypothetical protein
VIVGTEAEDVARYVGAVMRSPERPNVCTFRVRGDKAEEDFRAAMTRGGT